MHGGPLRRPISWLASQTPGIPQTPRPTMDWTCGSPGILKPTGSRTLRSDRKQHPPLHHPIHHICRQLSL